MDKRMDTLREIFLEMAYLVTPKQISSAALELQTDYATVSAYLQGQIQDQRFAEKLLAALKTNSRIPLFIRREVRGKT